MSFAVVKGGSGGKDAGSEERAMPLVYAKEASRIAQFLQRQLLSDRPEGKPVFLVLRHIANGRIGDKIDSARIDEIEPEQVRQLALQIYEIARNDAEGYGKHLQRYILQTYAEDKPGSEPAARVVFEISATASAVGEDIDSEPPTAQGLVQQLMRQNEQLHTQALDMLEAVTATAGTMFLSMKQHLQDINGELKEERAGRKEERELVEKARLDSWERERQIKQLDAEVEVKKELTAGIKLLLPAVAKRVGLIDPKQPIPADEAVMIALAESLNAEQWGALMGPESPFNEKQKLLFNEFAAFHLERMSKAAEAQQEPKK